VPVYEWLRHVDMPGGVVEWPLGFPYDCEYTLRQAEHEKPLLNGHSSFAPKPYEELYALVHQRPIPDTLWEKVERLDGSLVVLHLDAPTESGLEKIEYLRLIRRGIAAGRVEPLGTFPHGKEIDILLRPAGAAFRPKLPPGSADEALQAIRTADARIAPPFGDITFPQPVSPGDWQGGWALDDSGIAEIRISSERGPEGLALLHMRMPGLSQAFPSYPEAKDDRGGFGFPIPDLSPGNHELTFMLTANDGGRTIVSRRVVVVAKTPRAVTPGS
jgi:hypothetical protein